MKSIIKNAAFAFGMCFLGMAAAQAGQAGYPQLVVSYGDLDVAHEQGAQALVERIRLAATRVCGGRPDNRDLGAWMRYHSCTHKAADDAVARVGSPLVSAVYGSPFSQLARR